jgi:hypothetical protein
MSRRKWVSKLTACGSGTPSPTKRYQQASPAFSKNAVTECPWIRFFIWSVSECSREQTRVLGQVSARICSDFGARIQTNMSDEEERWYRAVIAKMVEIFGNPHDCTLADEKVVEDALAAEGIYPPSPSTPI